MAVALFYRMSDRMHQVGLAKADAAVDEKRIVSFTRRLRGGETGGMCKLIACTDNKLFECVFRIKGVFDRFEVQEIRRAAADVSGNLRLRFVAGSDRETPLLLRQLLSRNIRELRLGCFGLVDMPFNSIAVEIDRAESSVQQIGVIQGNPVFSDLARTQMKCAGRVVASFTPDRPEPGFENMFVKTLFDKNKYVVPNVSLLQKDFHVRP